ncbi:hypothetical protein G6F46_015231 [Rhizopus delemar]|nr:hypothetical protein G6F46_015231 [Rhizopus delemar]
MGNSAGTTTGRAAQSANTSASAPAMTVAGSSQRWLAPSVMRTRCGTPSPTNTMVPVAATSGPTISALANTSLARTRLSA